MNVVVLFTNHPKRLILVLKSSLGEPLGPVKLGSCKVCLERYFQMGCAGNFPGNILSFQAVPKRGVPDSKAAIACFFGFFELFDSPIPFHRVSWYSLEVLKL